MKSLSSIKLKIFENNWLVLGFLVGFPLIIIGILAINSLVSNNQSIQIERKKVETNFLLQIKNEIDVDVVNLVEDVVNRVQVAVDNGPIAATRRLVFNSDIGFVIVLKNGIRVFPPENSGETYVFEQAMLSRLAGEIDNALLKLQVDQRYQSLVNVSQEHTSALIHCQNLKEPYDVCVLIGGAQLKSSIDRVIEDSLRSHSDWDITLNDYSGKMISGDVSPISNIPDVRLALAVPLHGWVLQGQHHDSVHNDLSLLGIVLTITLPLTISWVVVFLMLYRSQQAKVREHTKRADLAAHLSHELRTPIANLSLYIDLVRRKSKEDSSINKYVQVMQEEVERLSRVSEKSISVAQGKFYTDEEKLVRPDEIIEKLLSQFSVLFKQSSCDVRFDGAASTLVIIDSMALESIILQLLDNACKYGGNRIDVSTSIDNNILSIRVRDYGQGISEGEEELIFEGNYRSKRSLSEKGFGIGLGAARYLAKLNGGDIHIENANPGARFTVSILIGDMHENSNS